jgi:hypothetical protein
MSLKTTQRMILNLNQILNQILNQDRLLKTLNQDRLLKTLNHIIRLPTTEEMFLVVATIINNVK